ncbi:Tn3 family transposase [Streptomyces sp. NPDC006602]|uniref:Tn3 family transposase n=1 Tax=Streptomyces sp. NPDC006602 TaxID=3364751 RepID=UPI0036CDDEDA
MIGKQLNIVDARHRLARRIFFGQRGELRQHYRLGMEDQPFFRPAQPAADRCANRRPMRTPARRSGSVAQGRTVHVP